MKPQSAIDSGHSDKTQGTTASSPKLSLYLSASNGFIDPKSATSRTKAAHFQLGSVANTLQRRTESRAYAKLQAEWMRTTVPERETGIFGLLVSEPAYIKFSVGSQQITWFAGYDFENRGRPLSPLFIIKSGVQCTTIPPTTNRDAMTPSVPIETDRRTDDLAIHDKRIRLFARRNELECI